MKRDDLNEIMRTAKALHDSLSVPVMLDHGEVLKLIVSDLVAKYKSNVERGNAEWISVFEKVLSYYLSREELEAITSQANASGEERHE